MNEEPSAAIYFAISKAVPNKQTKRTNGAHRGVVWLQRMYYGLE